MGKNDWVIMDKSRYFRPRFLTNFNVPRTFCGLCFICHGAVNQYIFFIKMYFLKSQEPLFKIYKKNTEIFPLHDLFWPNLPKFYLPVDHEDTI